VPTKLKQFLDAMEAIAPTRFAESWDNVGLLAGDPGQDVSAAMLTIDYTPEVACEAAGKRCDLIVSYHPPIFSAIKRVTASGSTAAVFDAIRRGVAIYSPHTALDVAPGGTNDMLADAIGLTDRQPLKVMEPRSTHCKLVTFVPEEALEKVSQAIFAAGAGQIGNYSSCSFQQKGTGTFFGEAGTDPAVGKAGRLERVNEIRLETVVPISAIDRVVTALKQSHPYEEPAFDLNMLAAAPEGLGMGRIGALPSTPREKMFERIKRELNLSQFLIAGPTTGTITRAAVCAGACGDLLDQAIAQKAQLYVTGEMRHHDALKAARAGLTVVCLLHSNSERAVLKRLGEGLSKRLPELAISLSEQDRDPFVVA
jgi:dinuclear metal center YbgI/SA1388 family protein